MNQKRPRTFLQWMNGGRYVWWRWGIAYLIIVPSSVVLYQLLGWVGVLLVVVPTIGYAALVLLVETLVGWITGLSESIQGVTSGERMR